MKAARSMTSVKKAMKVTKLIPMPRDEWMLFDMRSMSGILVLSQVGNNGKLVMKGCEGLRFKWRALVARMRSAPVSCVCVVMRPCIRMHPHTSICGHDRKHGLVRTYGRDRIWSVATVYTGATMYTIETVY